MQEFQDCIDILTEIILKFKTTHEIVIGGDLNEDLGSVNSSKRLLYLDELIKEQELCFSLASNTYTNSQGADCSEIEHFLSRTSKKVNTSNKCVINEIGDNTSDHLPIQIIITCEHINVCTSQ